MKYVFLTVWWLVPVPLIGLALYAVCTGPTLGSLGFLAGASFLALCTWQMIREGYRDPALLGNSRLGFWLCLLLLPLSLLPLHAAWRTWELGVYVADPSSSRRGSLLSGLLETLQWLVGPWGPIVALLALGLLMAYWLLRGVLKLRR